MSCAIELDRVQVRRDSGLYGYERALKRVGLDPVAGADEAGRGACAGRWWLRRRSLATPSPGRSPAATTPSC